MQFVGEAVRDHLITLGNNDNNIVALGIATWGCIANREALDGEEVSCVGCCTCIEKKQLIFLTDLIGTLQKMTDYVSVLGTFLKP